MNRRVRAFETALDGDEGEVYRISYASLAILLLAFFVFLVSLTTADAIKSSNVRESLDENFVAAEQRRVEDVKQLTALASSYNFEVAKGSDHILITLPGAGVFESGSDVVKAEMVPALVGIAERVRTLGLSAVIEGHTDTVPITSGRFPSNWELSAARATSVLRIFMEHGVPSARLAAAGRGEYFPVAGNDSEEGRAKNRRVTLRLRSADIEGL